MTNKIQEAQKLLQKLNSDIAAAEQRLEIATNVASSLEGRNKLVIEGIENSSQRREKLVIEQIEEIKETLNDEIAKLKDVKNHLSDEIKRLAKRKSDVEVGLSDIVTAKTNLSDEIIKDSEKKQDLLNEILKLTNEVKEWESKVNNYRGIVRSLSDTKQQLESDIDILRQEHDAIGIEILEEDGKFKDQKEYYQNEIYRLGVEVDKANLRLNELRGQDKAFRESWAEEHLKLDKRTETVRRLEAKLSNAQARIEELERYGAL